MAKESIAELLTGLPASVILEAKLYDGEADEEGEIPPALVFHTYLLASPDLLEQPEAFECIRPALAAELLGSLERCLQTEFDKRRAESVSTSLDVEDREKEAD